MSEVKKRAEQSREKKAALGPDLNLEEFLRRGGEWAYDPDFRHFDAQERGHLLKAGIELTDADHAGTYLQADTRVVHCQTNQPGLEVLPITEALKRHDWVASHLWRLVQVDADKYTARAELELDNGYFIQALPGAKVAQPVEACLYLRTDRFAQYVHNLVVVEPGAHLHIIRLHRPPRGARRAAHRGLGILRAGRRPPHLHHGAKLGRRHPRAAPHRGGGGRGRHLYFQLPPF